MAVRFYFWRSSIERELLSNGRVVETPLGRVEYAERGEGTAVLLLHGTPGGYDQVLGFVAANGLANSSLRYIMPSRPGYLRTPLTSGRTPREQARLFAALLTKLEIEKVIVVGASGGGPSALEFALLYPDKCSALILEEAATQRIAVRDKPVPPLLIDLILFAAREAMRWQPLPKTPDERITAELQAAQIESLVPYGERTAGLSNDYYQFARMAPLPLEQIRCPTLILHGTADQDVQSRTPNMRMLRSRILSSSSCKAPTTRWWSPGTRNSAVSSTRSFRSTAKGISKSYSLPRLNARRYSIHRARRLGLPGSPVPSENYIRL